MASSNDETERSARPNVVFMVGDNVGWGDISCYGGLAPTPRLDALAGEGLRIFDLIDDPNEEWDMVDKRLEGAWVIGAVAARLGVLEQSMAKYPNIEPGKDFAGYA